MAVFYVAASLSGAFSGLLAFAIQELDGRSGLDGWQWIFCECLSSIWLDSFLIRTQ